jgi:hypothetical protein
LNRKSKTDRTSGGVGLFDFGAFPEQARELIREVEGRHQNRPNMRSTEPVRKRRDGVGDEETGVAAYGINGMMSEAQKVLFVCDFNEKA